ncbi:hypothetical protein [Brevibacillus sp. HB2.2]|uniref:hypothetical protein n=1 Tax=Brevibacillus sp. HB2.2 TaxID=2738846 RepID=UPI00156B52E8|nr:hypothetical protein [Brevibacillus sp. HB2.2]NRS51997.1 hypothetical protein [Brevibacillus sp. HB2.2]
MKNVFQENGKYAMDYKQLTGARVLQNITFVPREGNRMDGLCCPTCGCQKLAHYLGGVYECKLCGRNVDQFELIPTEQFLEQDMSVEQLKGLFDIKRDMMLLFLEDKAALIDDIKKLRSRLIEVA